MKKFILTVVLFLSFTQIANAAPSTLLFKSSVEKQNSQSAREIKAVLKDYANFENVRDIKGLDGLYSEDYMTVDAFPKKVYFDIINKTWARYTDIKHNLKIKKIEVNGEYARAEVVETIVGKTTEKIENDVVEGDLKSTSNVVYYFHKSKNKWKFLSDYVIDEQTFLMFDDAKNLNVEFYAPNRILADKEYVATLNLGSIPRNYLVIATIGQEKIIYPHINAEEVYRKIPNNGILERVFKSNKDNLNEYVVATYCLTKPRVTEENQLETLLTGVGYVINRVNVVPENKFITVEENGEKEKK